MELLGLLTLALFLYMTIIFLFAYYTSDNSIVDVAWGIGFIIVTALTFFYVKVYTPPTIIIFGCVLLWGLRLTGHILLRKNGFTEDKRYADLRMSWKHQFILKSFFGIFMFQGLLIFAITYAHVVAIEQITSSVSALFFVGLFIWIFGFFYEIFADYQLMIFKKNPLNQGAILTKGLWTYSRHPNYFGEITLWWGMWLLAFSISGSWVTIISPIVITLFLMHVTGVPMLEKYYRGNKQYSSYAKHTPALFPKFWR
ncbi:MAG: steroid 5-alpha reductase family enzyme [Candidatus Woesearchaeota archaeon]|jgi:steroid 5-alpha reductase family enzyme